MKDLLSASLMASIVAVQPKEHMVSKVHSATPMSVQCVGSSCVGGCDGSCQGDCTASCKGRSR